METKKSPKANLELFRKTATLAGFFITLLVLYFVLNSSFTQEPKENLLTNNSSIIEEEQVPITKEEPKQQPIQKINIDPTTINVVNNETTVKVCYDPIIEDPQIPIEIEPIDPFENTTQNQEEEVFIATSNPPVLKAGGEAGMRKWIAENVVYPQEAIDNGIEGTVYLRFIVTKEGKVGKIEIIKGVDPLLDKAAIDVIKKLPPFQPGYQAGRPVNVWMSVPIVFQLQKN